MASVHAVITNSASQLLFLKRSQHTTRPGQWTVPGGRVKEKESSEMALRREILEESGLIVTGLHVVHQFSHQTYFHAIATEMNVVVAPREVSEFVWIEPENLLTIGMISDLKQLRLVFGILGIEIGPRFVESDPASSESA